MKLVIEADGSIHNEAHNIEYDNARTKRLNECGMDVLRFTNDEIENKTAEVIQHIEQWIKRNKR